jgi:hypothetical protein
VLFASPIGAIVLALAASGVSDAVAIRTDSGFTTNVLAPNDDGSVGPVALGFTINFFGSTYGSSYVNNNGNVTFDVPLPEFNPFDLLSTSTPIIAPFFADVDTRGAGSSPVTYGTSTIDGRNAFGVNWVNVGYWSFQDNPLNSFQLVLIDRSDVGVGDFDFEFNYDQILWESGGASGGSNGLGGNSARAGWSNGQSVGFELPGSAVNGAFLDNGPNSLSATTGRTSFSVRNGVVSPPTEPPAVGVPDGGGTLALCSIVFVLGFGCKFGFRLLKI